MATQNELDYLIDLCQRCFPDEKATRYSKLGPTPLWRFSHYDGGYERAVYYYRQKLGEVPKKPKRKKQQCNLQLSLL